MLRNRMLSMVELAVIVGILSAMILFALAGVSFFVKNTGKSGAGTDRAAHIAAVNPAARTVEQTA